MSFFPTEQEIISFDRPLFYSGDIILTSVQKQLKHLRDKGDLSEDEEKLKQFLHRVNTIIVPHKIYNLSIDNAVQVGILE